MIANYRSFFCVLGSILAFSGSALSFSAAAQDVAPTPMLNPQEFSAVVIPDNFNVAEHITWGARALVNHSDLKEIVPVFGYRSSDVCNHDNSDLLLNLPDPKPGALFFDVEGSESGRAVWLNSLEDVCNANEYNGNISWNITSDNTDPSAWEYAAAQIGNDLLIESNQSPFVNAQPKHFILTIGHLPGVIELGSYWWICNSESALTEDNTACYVTLSASPYRQHRNRLQ